MYSYQFDNYINYEGFAKMIFKNRHSTKIIISVLILIIAYNILIAKRLPETIIRIGVLEDVRAFNIGCDTNYSAINVITGCNMDLSWKDYFLVSVSRDGIKVNNQLIGDQVRFIPKESDGLIRVEGRRYRDTILVKKNKSGNMDVINELGIEGYLYGVMAREVSPQWNMEALKCQAIVSRTFVLKNLKKYGSKGFDLTATITSQVYGGVNSENPRSNYAVDITRGQVLTYRGELIKVFFHSNSGGYTEDIRDVWGGSENPPYLPSKVSKFSKGQPHYKWGVTLSKERIASALRKAGYRVGRIKKMRVMGRNKSGRTTYLAVYHDQGMLRIMGSKFRMALGPNLIKSTLMGFKNSNDKIYFYGRGWGHGVGMCQWGAKKMADRGYSYRKILNFYFPHTKIEKWEY